MIALIVHCGLVGAPWVLLGGTGQIILINRV